MKYNTGKHYKTFIQTSASKKQVGIFNELVIIIAIPGKEQPSISTMLKKIVYKISIKFFFV